MPGNVIGVAALVVFVSAGLAAGMWAVVRLAPRMRELSEPGFDVWKHAGLRAHLLPFIGLCALGVLAALVGFVFGEWPVA
jgi:hypothetical protein